jgi:VIT1/CCC1 family predicted Fe2+/Mn2+ transporter
MILDEPLRRQLLSYQKNEITEHHIYSKLAMKLGSANRSVLEQMAEQELRHYLIWRKHTGQEVGPNWFAVWRYYLLSRVLGITFGAKLLERWEKRDQACYEQIQSRIPEADLVRQEECGHEAALLRMLDERKLRYTGSMVLGLSDALVELTGAAAGLTLALRNTRLVALAILVTGIAAALSMASSAYLASRSEETAKNPLTAALYTGAAYLATVLILVLPYLLLRNPYLALAVTVTGAVLVSAFFNFYVAVAKDEPFGRRFLEMTGLTLGIAAIGFLLGLLLRQWLPVDA